MSVIWQVVHFVKVIKLKFDLVFGEIIPQVIISLNVLISKIVLEILIIRFVMKDI